MPIHAEPFLARISKGASVSFIIKIAGVLITYLFSLIISNTFGADKLGLFFISVTIVDVLATLSIMGYDQSIVLTSPRTMPAEKEKDILARVLTMVILSAGLWSIVLYHGREIISATFFGAAEGLPGFLALFSFSIIPISVIKICANYYRKQHKIARYGVFLYLATYSASVLLFFILSRNGDPLSIPRSFLLASGTSAAAALVLLRKHITRSAIEHPGLKGIGSFTVFSLPFMGSELLTGVFGWIVILASGMFFTTLETGVFSLITKIAFALSMFSTAVNAALLPSLVKSESRKNRKRFFDELRFGWKAAFLSTAIAALFLLLLSPLVLQLAFPRAQDAALAYLPLSLLSLAMVIESAVALSASFFSALHKQKHLFIAGAVKSLSFLLLLVWRPGGMSMTALAIYVAGSVLLSALYIAPVARSLFAALSTTDKTVPPEQP